MASLWIRFGYDVKAEMSAQTYQSGARFKAFIEVLMASLKIVEIEKFLQVCLQYGSLTTASAMVSADVPLIQGFFSPQFRTS